MRIIVLIILISTTQFCSVSSLFDSFLNVSNFNVVDKAERRSFGEGEQLVVLQYYPDSILLGGRNSAYNVSLRRLSDGQIFEWPTAQLSRLNCASISQSAEACDNFIRTFFALENSFVMCGTNGMQPACGEFRRTSREVQRTTPAVGLSPVDASFTAPFLRIDDFIFTANIPQLSSSEPLLIRQSARKLWQNGEDGDILRTPRGQNTFEDASFVAMHQNNNEVFVFFSESSSEAEGCGMRRVARVGRVCQDDPGGRLSYSTEWTSFVKARLECSIEEDGQDTLFFNQMVSVSETRQHFYGAFRSQLAGIGASALCRYERSHVSTALASGYKRTASRNDACPRATTMEEFTNLRVKPLLKNKIIAKPIFVYHGKDRFVHITTQENVRDLRGRRYDVTYVATNKGNIFKVITADSDGTTRHAVTMKLFETVEKIVSMKIHTENLANRLQKSYLLVVTDQQVVKVATTQCGQASSCGSCLAMADPQCAWIEADERCVDTQLHASRRNYASQESGTCNVAVDSAPVSLAPLRPKSQPICLCESSSSVPCTTEVIQKEIVSDAWAFDLWKLTTAFALGLVVGSIFNCFYFYFRRLTFNNKCIEGGAMFGGGEDEDLYQRRQEEKKTTPTLSAIDAFSTSAHDVFNTSTTSTRFNNISIHSSVQTYC